MFAPLTLFLLVVVSGHALAQEKDITQGDHTRLIEKISSIIADDVVKFNRRLPGVKSKAQEEKFLKSSAQKSFQLIEPYLKDLIMLASQQNETVKDIVLEIETKAAAKAAEKFKSSGDLQPRFLGNAVNNLMQMTLNFVTSVFAAPSA